MTSDELRTQCIEAMAKGMTKHMALHEDAWRHWLKECTAAFDALHGTVRVVPINATEEMVRALYKHCTLVFTENDEIFTDGNAPNEETFYPNAMLSVGDITRPK